MAGRPIALIPVFAMRGETSQPLTNPLAFPNQHYNSITSWGIDNKGEIKHVYA